ncbi:MAG TPA: PAS domain S-box protein, partial [Blastocatellia bacterium]|nr:PAS domain S-box protein [Blastocatellia bacterium]
MKSKDGRSDRSDGSSAAADRPPIVMVFKDECDRLLFDSSLLDWLKNFADRGVFTTDEELKICTWNRWMELYSGRSAAEVTGRQLLEIYPELKERRLEQYYRDAQAGQSRTLSQRLHGYLLPMRPILTDLGFNLMRQSAQIMPLLAEGRIVGTITLIEDVTERAATEQRLRRQVTELEHLARALHENEQWLQTTLRSIGDAVIATDAQGQVAFVNGVAESLTGWSQEEAQGEPLARIFTLIDEETHAPIDNPAQAVLQEGTTVGLANKSALLTRDGRAVPIDDSAAPIKNDAGQVTGVVLVFRDVTERRLAEAAREKLLSREHVARLQAEEASRLKDEFLATVSHELRTPLNAMLGWTRILRAGGLNQEEVRRAIETIERSARAQNQLIEDLLDVSRIISGKLRLDLRPVELPIVIEAAIDTMRPAAGAKGIQLDYALDTTVGPVLSDSDRLQQVVWNLLANAIKFTPQGGRVDVQLRREGDQAQIVVSDTGRGISAEFLPYVFDRFRQADHSFSRQQGGLGLGLAIVR